MRQRCFDFETWTAWTTNKLQGSTDTEFACNTSQQITAVELKRALFPETYATDFIANGLHLQAA